MSNEKHQAGLNHGDTFAAASIAKAFFEVSFSIVKDYGDRVQWDGSGRALAAATLTQACATVYAANIYAQNQERPPSRCRAKRAPVVPNPASGASDENSKT
jgi:hypothetical protein